MGSIIAYDVMTQYAPDVSIDTFVTIGSPLGPPIIKSKIVAERKKEFSPEEDLKTPENVLSNWHNLADIRDKIAISYDLSDDLKENTRHIRPVDKMVFNDYDFMGEKIDLCFIAHGYHGIWLGPACLNCLRRHAKTMDCVRIKTVALYRWFCYHYTYAWSGLK